MRLYDIYLVFRGAQTGPQREKLIDAIKKWLGTAKITKVDDWGKKNLAYPLKKEMEGYYEILTVESEISIPSDLDKRIHNEEAILRHLVVRRD